jgi:hypothetical protein
MRRRPGTFRWMDESTRSDVPYMSRSSAGLELSPAERVAERFPSPPPLQPSAATVRLADGAESTPAAGPAGGDPAACDGLRPALGSQTVSDGHRPSGPVWLGC